MRADSIRVAAVGNCALSPVSHDISRASRFEANGIVIVAPEKAQKEPNLVLFRNVHLLEQVGCDREARNIVLSHLADRRRGRPYL